MLSRLSIKKVQATPPTIKGQVLLVALSEVLLLIFFAGFAVYASHRDNLANQKEANATAIVKAITEIRFETFDYILYHDNLSYNQWQIEHNRLSDMLKRYPISDAQEKTLMASIQAQHLAVVSLFDGLRTSYSAMSSPQHMADLTQYQDLLAFRLVSKQQIEVSSAFELSSLKHEELLRVRQQTKTIATIIITLMVLITGINLMFIYGKISKALTVLQYGALQIAKGVLSYRIRYKRKNDEFGLLAASFNNMAESLEQVDKVKSEFVLLVSHQLRTPATAVKGFLSLFDDMPGKGLSVKQRQILSSAYEENERQIKLINEILAVAQVEAGQIILNKQPTDLVPIIDGILAEQQLFFEQQHQNVVFTKPAHPLAANIDSGRIHIVLENLIRNAGKFTPDQGIIEIKLRTVGSSVEVTVKDTGPGISKDDMSKLFKKFSRVGSASTIRSEGSGLGLYLSKRIVDMHKGEITASSRFGKGTTFVVKLPKL